MPLMPLEAKKYLWDALTAADLVAQMLVAKALDDYLTDVVIRSAVERQLEIVGEALSQLSRRYPEVGDQVPGIERIIAFRNRLIHGYGDVDSFVVWGVTLSQLPSLRVTLRAMLEGA